MIKKEKNNYLKQSKGITLVALVVTIVILIILAGVSISLVLGDNGIVTKAKDAKKQNEESALKEDIDLAVLEAKMEGLGLLDKATLQEKLEKISGATVTYDNNTEKFTVSRGGYAFKVDLNGNVETANGIALNKSTLKLVAGTSQTLTVSYLGSASGAVTWTTSNANAATVANGVITTTASSTGTTTITATCGSYTASCTVTIVQKVTSIAAEALTVGIGATKNINITTEPTGEVEKLTFVSNDEEIATVDENGKVTGLKAGTTTITIAGSVSTTVTGTCNVTVTEPSFSDYSWEEINALAKAISNDTDTNGATTQVSKVIDGTTYTAKVGDTTTITDLVNPETTYTVRILGFNYDDLATNNQYDGTATSTGKAGISFEFVSFLKVQNSTDTTNSPIPYTTTAKMNSSNTNSGGWMSSAMKTTLANTVNNLSNNSYIKEVKKPSIGGSVNNWSLNETNTDKLWLLSEFEVFGTQTYATAAKESNYTNAAYAYYANSGSKVKNSSSWWLRSPLCSSNFFFCVVNSSGDLRSSNANNTFVVAPGFSI